MNTKNPVLVFKTGFLFTIKSRQLFNDKGQQSNVTCTFHSHSYFTLMFCASTGLTTRANSAVFRHISLHFVSIFVIVNFTFADTKFTYALTCESTLIISSLTTGILIIIIVTGLTLAFGDTSGGFRRLIQIVFGISIAFAASSFFLSFFSFGGGALI